MWLSTLSVRDFRNLAALDLQWDHAPPALVVVSGDNGAGKTSLLEALHLVLRGRTNRGHLQRLLLRAGCSASLIQARLTAAVAPADNTAAPTPIWLHLGFSAISKVHHCDQQPVTSRAQLARLIGLVSFFPHHLAAVEEPDGRRRELDSALGHDAAYQTLWIRYYQALRQRNAALRAGQLALCEPIEALLAEAGEEIQVRRQAWLEELRPLARALAAELGQGFATLALELRPGFEPGRLRQQLDETRVADLQRGHTTLGPQRADLRLLLGGRDLRQASRGQQRALWLVFKLASAHLKARRLGHAPLLLLDDLAAELGPGLAERLLALAPGRSQIWLTVLDGMPRPAAAGRSTALVALPAPRAG